MQRGDAAFTGSVPELYDAHLGPLLFEPYASDIAQRVRAHAASRILETAAGTGRVTRALAEAIPDARITATDLNRSDLHGHQAFLPASTPPVSPRSHLRGQGLRLHRLTRVSSPRIVRDCAPR